MKTNFSTQEMSKKEHKAFWRGYQLAIYLLQTSNRENIEEVKKQLAHMEKDSDKYLEEIEREEE